MPNPNPTRRPAPGYGSSRTTTEKLGIYLVGVAIGLLVLGWFQWQKMQAAAASQNAPATPDSAGSTAPAAAPTPPDPGG